MVQIKPQFDCNEELYSDDIFCFHGKVFLWKKYDEDQKLWYQSLPIGHCNSYPIRFLKNGKETDYDPIIKDWLAIPLIRSVVESKIVAASINKYGSSKHKKVVITNCLDDCFGHVVYKLLSLEQHTDENTGTVAIVPVNIKWMVPEFVDEIWVVSAPLSGLCNEVEGLDSFIKKELARFEQVYLNDRYGIPKVDDAIIEQFFGQLPFPSRQFYQLPATITFIYRNDRFWLPGRGYQGLYLFCKKYRLLKLFKPYFIFLQLRLFTQLARHIKNHLPEVKFYLAGLGNEQKVADWIHDIRQDQLNEEIEALFNRIYAQSHLVIGVHGSNMLIPTALAAGYINLLPDFKIPNMTEDVIRPVNSRSSLFMGRHLPAYTKSGTVGDHAVGMIRGFKNYIKDS